MDLFPRNKVKINHPSDSDCSLESNNSFSQGSNQDLTLKSQTQSGVGSSIGSKKGVSGGGLGVGPQILPPPDDSWEVLEGLKEGQRAPSVPNPHSGYLHKKRKWPLKGWHKRYFLVEKGILIYGKSPSGVSRGKLHGSVDVGLSVVSAKRGRRRLDIDAEEFIYHLRAKSEACFEDWLEVLKCHRLYRQDVLSHGRRGRGGVREEEEEEREEEVEEEEEEEESEREVTEEEEGGGGRDEEDGGRRRRGGKEKEGGEGGGRKKKKKRGLYLPRSVPSLLPLPPPSTTLASRELSQARQCLLHLGRILDEMEGGETTSMTSHPGGSSRSDDSPVFHGNPPPTPGPPSSAASSPNPSKKERKRFPRLRRRGGGKADALSAAAGGGSVEGGSIAGALAPPQIDVLMMSNLFNNNNNGSGRNSITSAFPFTNPDNRLSYEFLVLAKDVHRVLRGVASNLEEARLKVEGGFQQQGGGSNPDKDVNQSLRSALKSALRNNKELKSRLMAIHRQSAGVLEREGKKDPLEVEGGEASLSYPSSCLSSEFYDAEDASVGEEEEGSGEEEVKGVRLPPRLPRVTSLHPRPPPSEDASSLAPSVSSDEGILESLPGEGGSSGGTPGRRRGVTIGGADEGLQAGTGGGSSEASENESEYEMDTGGRETGVCSPGKKQCDTGRRRRLPAARNPGNEGVSLWNLLSKNIGKDLSQVSMPVVLNEPLNMLQRLCEELEYSDLLDKAADFSDPYERMLYVAAFAVSAYGSSAHRAGSKPFNPLLGETYEAIREDRGFKFISEQVSHHPAVSACFAESKNFVFWQDVRIKTKFWGKSMEFQPSGRVNVKLESKSGKADLYRWNKVTTCVHNLFSAQSRWVDQYGELTITSDSNIKCIITFDKASYWSAKRHELHGGIYDGWGVEGGGGGRGRKVRNLFGKWDEGLYCGDDPNSAKCIWRPGSMPEEYRLYYGFTRFAMELNELDEENSVLYPPTDTRFRPDQRFLEEGRLEEAEEMKSFLEKSQRDRRKINGEEGRLHIPKWFRKTIEVNGEDNWEYAHNYWEAKRNPGFRNMVFDRLW